MAVDQDNALMSMFYAQTRVGITEQLKELLSHRELAWTWMLREIKIRYKQTLLGGAWAIFQPLALMLMFTLIFSHFVKIETGDVPYPLFSYAAVLPWTFLYTSITFGTSSLLNNIAVVTKTYFPREVLPIASIGAAFLDFLVASSVFFLLLFSYRIPISGNIVWLPILVALQVLLTLGITFVTSSLSVYFRDVRFLVPLGLQLWFYATPVIYPLNLVPDRLRGIYMLNPMASIVSSYRRVLLEGQHPDLASLAVTFVSVMVVLAIGYFSFKRLEESFADVI